MSKMVREVREMNNVFGNLEGNMFDPNWERIITQAECLFGEVNEELMEAAVSHDMTALRDVISDIMVFNIGLAHVAGIPLENDMHKVFKSNMSKLCETPEILEQSCLKYEAMGLEVEPRGVFPKAYVVSAKDQWLGDKYYPKGKFLKGVRFREPVFE